MKPRKTYWLPRSQFMILFVFVFLGDILAQTGFVASGNTDPDYIPEREDDTAVVKVLFDLLPTKMSFDVPWNYCMVAENRIKFAFSAPETYDPRNWDPDQPFLTSWEVGMDDQSRYLRIWVEHASDARIVVRIRYALCNSVYDIAHSDILSKSPYSKQGDWGEERYYIYPDGTNLRHQTVYTGLASMSLPFGFNRQPPQVVHEFMESVVVHLTGHTPEGDINSTNTVYLYKIFGNNLDSIYPGGIGTKISYNPCPDDYGSFNDANIMVINSKSQYKPFTIALPYGIRTQPYSPSGTGNFETWPSDYPGNVSVSAIGHMLNYWHYNRTDSTIEQVFLHGMTNIADPQADLVDLAWSWIEPPALKMEGYNQGFNKITYDQAQKAYLVPHDAGGPGILDFTLDSPENKRIPLSIVNPAFIVRNWNDTINGIVVKVDDVVLEAGRGYRYGFEQSDKGTDLIIWLPMKSGTAKHFTIMPE